MNSVDSLNTELSCTAKDLPFDQKFVAINKNIMGLNGFQFFFCASLLLKLRRTIQHVHGRVTYLLYNVSKKLLVQRLFGIHVWER